MKKKLYLLGLLLPCFAWANNSSTVIDSRQQAFSNIEQQLEKAEDTLDGKETNWGEITAIATKLQSASETLKHSFPQGSQTDSKASEKIWQDPEQFQQLMTKMDQGFIELYQASEQQNPSMAEEAIDSAQDTCRSCHRNYRSRW